MSKARDLANIISGGFTASDIPNLSANKITADTLGADRIPALPTSKITSGTFDDARISSSSVTQHVTSYTHPNHSGEVTSTGDGATVVADDIIDEANLKVSNSPVDGYALTAQSGNTGGLTWAEVGGQADNYFQSGLNAKDLGNGLHVKVADSGGSANNNADDLIVEGSGSTGITLLAGDSSITKYAFGDASDNQRGYIAHEANNDNLSIYFRGHQKEQFQDKRHDVQVRDHDHGGNGSTSQRQLQVAYLNTGGESATLHCGSNRLGSLCVVSYGNDDYSNDSPNAGSNQVVKAYLVVPGRHGAAPAVGNNFANTNRGTPGSVSFSTSNASDKGFAFTVQNNHSSKKAMVRFSFL